MIAYTQAQSEEEIQEILHLQNQNLPSSLDKKEILEQGFLTVEHSFELLWRMNQSFPHTLAKKNGKVIGYALSMTAKFANDIPILHSLFKEIRNTYSSEDFIVMGQICIAKEYRGRGIFRGLYQNMQRFIKGSYETIITEVDIRNTRSMNAHKAIGFKELVRHESNGKVWSLIVLKK